MVKTAIARTSDFDGPVVIKLLTSVMLVTVNVLTVPADCGGNLKMYWIYDWLGY
jgi:hypothetical protein